MAWANVQHIANSSFQTDPVALAFSGNVTAGNLLFFAYQFESGVATTTFTQSAGTATLGTITTIINTHDSPDGQSLSIGWCLVTGTGSCTITANGGTAAGNSQLAISEWSGGDGSTTNDGTGAGQATTGANPNTGSWTCSTNGDLVIAAAVDTSGSGTVTKGSSFTLLETPFGNNALLVEWKTGTSGSTNADFNNSSSGDTTTMAGAAFTPAAGGNSSSVSPSVSASVSPSSSASRSVSPSVSPSSSVSSSASPSVAPPAFVERTVFVYID